MRVREWISALMTLAFCLGPPLAALAARTQAAEKQPPRSTTETLPNGTLIVRVENLSRAPITALLAVGKATLPDGRASGAVRSFDSVINSPIQHSVGPGQAYTLRIFPANPVRPLHGPPIKVETQAQLKAAIFANGKTWGDPSWIERLLRTRSEYLNFTEYVIAKLEAGLSSGAPFDRLAEQIRAEAQGRGYSDDRDIARQVFGGAAGQIRACMRIHGRHVRGCLETFLGRLAARRNRLLSSKPTLSALAHKAN